MRPTRQCDGYIRTCWHWRFGNIVGGAGIINDLIKFDAKILSNHLYKYAQRIDNKVVSAAKLTGQGQDAAKNLLKKTTKLGKK